MSNLGMGGILCSLNFSQQDDFFYKKTQDVDYVKDKDASYSL
jgi:hypothetical protein